MTHINAINGYLKERRGEELTAHEVSKALGIKLTTTETALGRLHVRPGPVRRISRGRYCYGRPAVVTPRIVSAMALGTMLECTGYALNGDPIVRDEDGRHFKLTGV